MISSEWQINRERERMASLDRVLEDDRSWYEMVGDFVEEVREHNMDPNRPINKRIAEEERQREQKKQSAQLVAQRRIEGQERRKAKREQEERKRKQIQNVVKQVPSMIAVFVMTILTFVPFMNDSERKIVSFDPPTHINTNYIAYADTLEQEEVNIELPLTIKSLNDHLELRSVISRQRNVPTYNIEKANLIDRDIS